MLNQETDALEDNNKQLDEKIKNYRELADMNDAEKKSKIEKLKRNRDAIKKEI